MLPWRARFPDRGAVLSEFWRVGSGAIGMSPAGGLDVADMLVASGLAAEARAVLEAYVDRPVRWTHVPCLERYLRERGHADLVPRIVAHRP